MRERFVVGVVNVVVTILIFFAGYFAGHHRAFKVFNEAVVQVNDATDTADAVARAAKVDAEAAYHRGVSDDKTQNEDSPKVVTHIVYRDSPDRMQHNWTSTTRKTNYTAADFQRLEATNTRLRDALSDALMRYGQEAERGNDVQRQVNLCIDQLEQDRIQVENAQKLQ